MFGRKQGITHCAFCGARLVSVDDCAMLELSNLDTDEIEIYVACKQCFETHPEDPWELKPWWEKLLGRVNYAFN